MFTMYDGNHVFYEGHCPTCDMVEVYILLCLLRPGDKDKLLRKKLLKRDCSDCKKPLEYRYDKETQKLADRLEVKS